MKKIILSFTLLMTSLSFFAKTPEKVNHVVYIGLDGWAANTFEKSDMPFVKELTTKGAWTLEKRSVLPSSSAINWASLFMGVGPEVHGYLNWGSKHPELTQPTGADKINGIFPTIFQQARLQKPDADIVGFYEWDGIKHLIDTLSFTHHEQVNAKEITNRTCDYIKKNKPYMTMIAFDRPDHPGHDNGWGSPEYYQMMTQIDSEIATIFKAIEEAGIADETLVIISSDHGGKGTGHGGTSTDEMLCPLIMIGPGVPSGKHITDMVIGPDVCVTIADRLGIKPSPYWRGKAILSNE